MLNKTVVAGTRQDEVVQAWKSAPTTVHGQTTPLGDIVVLAFVPFRKKDTGKTEWGSTERRKAG